MIVPKGKIMEKNGKIYRAGEEVPEADKPKKEKKIKPKSKE